MRRIHQALFATAAAATAVFGGAARADSLVRAPYIQTLTPSSAILVFTTDVAADSQVLYGTDPKNLAQKVQIAAAVTQHEVKLEGLTPGTRYYYSVGSAKGVLAGGDAAHTFETAPLPGTAKKFRAWIVGDSGTGDSRQAAVRDAMLAFAGPYRPHLFLHMGDMAYTSGTTNEFTNNFFKMYATVLENTVVWPTMGNHEGANSDSGTQTGPYYTAYVLPKAGEAGGLPSGTEAYYSFDYANVHFIVLDSHDSPRAPDGAMLTWMKADLAATAQDWLIAFWHHPPYTKGSHNSDTESQLIEMRQNALPILEAGGVDLVLTGHSHIYERSFLVDGAYATPTTAAGHIKDPGDGKPLGNGPYKKLEGNAAHDGAVYVVAGHGGTPTSGAGNHPLMYFSELDNGSCLIDVQENRLSFVNIRWDGVLSDRFSLVKGPGIVIAAPDGGERLVPGSAFDIQWATVGSVPEVKLEYSVNDGESWTPIVGSVANTGKHSWTVPSVETNKALIRVSNVVDPDMRDESNAGFAITATGPVDVISFGDTWNYDDQGKDHGTAWLDLGFDDSGWASGPGQLGYGDDDEATVLKKALFAYPSAYFRKVVTLSGAVTKADLKVLHDDGVAVWVNGKLVFSKYVDGGTGYGKFASETSQDNEISLGSLDPSAFVAGDNIIAVMVKQASIISSDLSFDLDLKVTIPPPQGIGGTGGAGTGGANGAGGDNEEATGGGDTSSSGGCGCGVAGSPGSPLALIGLGGLSLVYRRRRPSERRTARRADTHRTSFTMTD
jgi:MYXO-CTERM domain-containing protein